MAPKSRTLLDDLLAKNVEGKLSAEETKELDLLFKNVFELNLVKAREATALHRIRIYKLVGLVLSVYIPAELRRRHRSYFLQHCVPIALDWAAKPSVLT